MSAFVIVYECLFRSKGIGKCVYSCMYRCERRAVINYVSIFICWCLSEHMYNLQFCCNV